MRELFEFVLDLTETQFHSGGELVVEFDEKIGYPTLIHWDDHEGPHSAITIDVSNVAFEVSNDIN